jgi:hypothetical protein
MIKKFRETGSLLGKNRNRQKSVLTPWVLQDIQAVILLPTLTVNTYMLVV